MMTTEKTTRYGLDIRPTRAELPGPFDFHLHSCFSDAVPHMTPFRLCMQARNAGMMHIAITDHDYMMPEEERQSLSEFFGIDVVAGSEISAVWKIPNSGGRTVTIHLGVHWGTADDPELRSVLLHNQAQDFESYCKAYLEQLLYKEGIDPSGQGVDASWKLIRRNNPLSVHLGKREVGGLAAAAGYVSSRREATDRWLRPGCSCHVPAESILHFVSFEEAMAAITRHSLSTLNHLFAYGLSDEENHLLLREFKALGGNALEVVYPRYDRQQQRQLFRYCHQYDLIPNVGSDRHEEGQDFVRGDPTKFRRLRDRQRELHGPIRGGWDVSP